MLGQTMGAATLGCPAQGAARPRPHQRVAAWWLGQLKKRDLVTIIPDPRTGSLGHLRNPPRFLSEMEKSSGNSGYCDRMVLQAEKLVVV